MPTNIPEPREEPTDSEVAASVLTVAYIVISLFTAFFVYMATGNFWWAAATSFGLAAIGCLGFALVEALSISAERMQKQFEKMSGSGSFALVDASELHPGPDGPPES
jgi:predicted benzoate:H+ symporter BenE